MSHVRSACITGAVGLVGALVGVILAGQVHHRIGPFNATLSARPALHGRTVVELAPLGTIELHTHRSPFRIDVRVDQLRVAEARQLATDPSAITDLEPDIRRDARQALGVLVVRSFAAAIAGAALLSWMWKRTWRNALTGIAIGAATVVVASGLAVATRDPDALGEPKYSGLLTLAPTAVGTLEDVVNRFSEHRVQLSALVANVARLYQASQSLDAYTPAKDTIRVLHVSDIHLNPEAFDLIKQVDRQFDTDAVIDTGDINDWGTPFEAGFTDAIGGLKVPYVFIRGNHDSADTAAAVASQSNAIVLDGDVAEVAGLRVWGIADPRFTPDRTQFKGADERHDLAVGYAAHVASQARAATPIDVILVHDPATAAESGGIAPVVLAGHLHRPLERHLGDTLELVEGSTGGAGLRGLQKEAPVPLSCSVLYFDRATHRLRAYDRIIVNGVASGDVRIERKVLP